MNLVGIQSALFSLVTRDGETKVAAEAMVGGGTLTPDERVDIYAEMFALRTQDSIREDFPKVTQLLGDGFGDTVRAYVARYPSTHYSLSMLGKQFPQFLRDTGSVRLGDLAMLEWLHADMFVARDAEPLTAAALQGLDPEKFAAGKLHFIPGLALAWVTHDVRALWRAIEDGGPLPEADVGRTPLLVWRKGHEVFHVAIEHDEAMAIEALQRGEVIGVALEAFAERPDPAVAAFTAIGSWFNEGMIARVEL